MLSVEGLCRPCWRVVVLVAVVPGDYAREPGIVDRHWITPNPAAVARPRDAVTSAEPPPGSEVAIEPKTP